MSSFFAKAQSKVKDFDAVRTSKPQIRRRLPAGLRGVAQLTSIKIDQDTKGRDRMSIAAIVLSPEESNGETILNVPFWVQIPLYEATFDGRTTSIQDRLIRVSNTFQLLGGDVESCDDVTDLEKVMNDINKAKPYFRFSTYKQRDSDYVNAGIDAPAKAPETVTMEAETEVIEEEITATAPTPEELLAMGKVADKDGDADAIEALTELAGAQDIDPNSYPTWKDLAAAISELVNTTEEVEVEPTEEATEVEEPGVGQMCGVDIEDNGKLHSCEVQEVYAEDKTCDVYSYDVDDIYNVLWTDLNDDPNSGE